MANCPHKKTRFHWKTELVKLNLTDVSGNHLRLDQKEDFKCLCVCLSIIHLSIHASVWEAELLKLQLASFTRLLSCNLREKQSSTSSSFYSDSLEDAVTRRIGVKNYWSQPYRVNYVISKMKRKKTERMALWGISVASPNNMAALLCGGVLRAMVANSDIFYGEFLLLCSFYLDCQASLTDVSFQD